MDMTDRLKAMLSRGDDSAQLRFGLATALFARGELVAALEHARVAVNLDPDYSAAWRLVGRVCLELGNLEEAVRALETGIAVAERRGDRQLVKEMNVFLARVHRARTKRNNENDDTK